MFLGGGDIVEVERRLQSEIRTRDPPQAPVSDHHIRPRGTPALGSSALRYVLASPRRNNPFTGVQISPQLRLAGVELLPECGHDLTLVALGCCQGLVGDASASTVIRPGLPTTTLGGAGSPALASGTFPDPPFTQDSADWDRDTTRPW